MSRFSIGTGTNVNTTLVDAVKAPDANLVDEVAEGAVVKAVYIELWLIGSTADQHDIVTVSKQQQGFAGPTFADVVALGNYLNKKNILFTHQGLASNDGIAMPMAILRGWIKIPKSKQRFGLGDELVLSVASQGDATIFACGFATYKEYL